MTIQIAPSILSADFCNLERDLKAISNADLVHVDVMDHHFVPNLTLGEPIVARICEVTDLPVDVHLMIEDPDRWAPEYAKLGAASVSFHIGGNPRSGASGAPAARDGFARLASRCVRPNLSSRFSIFSTNST